MKEVTIQTSKPEFKQISEDLDRAIDEGMDALIKTVKREMKGKPEMDDPDGLEDLLYHIVDTKRYYFTDTVTRTLDKPDFVIGETKVFILGPHEQMKNPASKFGVWGPNSIVTYTQTVNGTQWHEVDLYHAGKWEWLASLAVIGAKVCETADLYWDSPEMEAHVESMGK